MEAHEGDEMEQEGGVVSGDMVEEQTLPSAQQGHCYGGGGVHLW